MGCLFFHFPNDCQLTNGVDSPANWRIIENMLLSVSLHIHETIRAKFDNSWKALRSEKTGRDLQPN